MAKETKGALVAVQERFDYSPLETKTAERVQAAAERIRGTVKRTLENIIDIGKELLAVKEALEHGQFGTWLRVEFGWTDRTARNFMGVAEQFGGKTETISDLIEPTAAYLLAAPSAPDEARQAAIELAEEGTPVTAKVAKKILAEKRKKRPRRGGKAGSGEQLGFRLLKVLERYRDRWNQKELSELAQQLREFADSLEEGRGSSKKKSG
jgi:hypothetical protein